VSDPDVRLSDLRIESKPALPPIKRSQMASKE
jgi:hypothetical protein